MTRKIILVPPARIRERIGGGSAWLPDLQSTNGPYSVSTPRQSPRRMATAVYGRDQVALEPHDDQVAEANGDPGSDGSACSAKSANTKTRKIRPDRRRSLPTGSRTILTGEQIPKYEKLHAEREARAKRRTKSRAEKR